MYRSRLAFALAMAALAAILLPSSLPAQITFQRTYGGTLPDYGCSVQQTIDGGYIIAGYTYSFGAGGTDVYLIKTDAIGDTLWTRTFGGAGYDCGNSVQQTTDGGYIVAGYTGSFGSGDYDVYLIKTDANGDTAWTRAFGGTDYDGGWSVQQTADGGYIISGVTESFGAGGYDVYLIKTDAVGDTQWTRTFGGPSRDEGNSAQQTTDGGYVIAGYVDSSGVSHVYLIKTGAHGDTMWTRDLGCGEANAVKQTGDGGYVIAGSSGVSHVYLIKTNANGDTLWTKTYSGAVGHWGYSVQQTADGGYVVAGSTYSSGAGNLDVYIIKTDAEGDTLWTRTFGDICDQISYPIQLTTDGGYVVAGSSYGARGWDVYLIKTDSLGNVAVSVTEPKASPPRAPALSLSCEPNPFRTRTAISLQLTADSPAELAIFDASGRRVRTFTVNRTPYTVWDGTGELGHALPSGTYFVLLAAAGQHATTRLVLQR